MEQEKSKRRPLGLVEITFLLAGAVAVGYGAGRYQTSKWLQPFLSASAAIELRDLEQRYGPGRNSEHGEEWILRDFFKDARDGVFVDVGANDYRSDSNTYYLETGLGWSGIAVEPQTKFAGAYAAHRPRTNFVPLFVSDVSNKTATLYVAESDLLASSDKKFAEDGGRAAVPMAATTSTLDDILDRSGLTKIDFLSIDVELHEPQVLRGFSIDRFRPRLVCIEAHQEVRQAILDFFADQGYVVLGKYLRADTENLWFAPRGLVDR